MRDDQHGNTGSHTGGDAGGGTPCPPRGPGRSRRPVSPGLPPYPELVRNPAGAPQHPLATTPVGPDLAALIAGADPRRLPDAALIDYLVACDRAQAALEAARLAAITEVARRCAALPGVGADTAAGQVPVDHVVASELAPALRVSRQAAENQLALALQLQSLPRTRAALASGELSVVKAKTIVEACLGMTAPQREAMEARIFPRALTQTLPLLQASLRRAALAIDPDRTRAQHAAATSQRGVWRRALGDGLAELVYIDDAAKVESAYQAVTEQARAAQEADRAAAHAAAAAPEDEAATVAPDGCDPARVRSLDQCRADVLGDLARAWLSGGTCSLCGTTTARRARVNVVVAASTLLGLDDEPGDLIGLGPIPADAAREFAADADWHRLLVEPGTRRLLDLTTRAHDPPPSMRRFVQARDGTCRAPGCRAPAHRCDLDHTIAHPAGDTCPGNLTALCRHHHRIKTHTPTRVANDGQGGLTWTTPLGKTYHRPANPVLDHPGLDIPPF